MRAVIGALIIVMGWLVSGGTTEDLAEAAEKIAKQVAHEGGAVKFGSALTTFMTIGFALSFATALLVIVRGILARIQFQRLLKQATERELWLRGMASDGTQHRQLGASCRSGEDAGGPKDAAAGGKGEASEEVTPADEAPPPPITRAGAGYVVADERDWLACSASNLLSLCSRALRM
eukprot:7382488-Prymnesium_polylepis.1